MPAVGLYEEFMSGMRFEIIDELRVRQDEKVFDESSRDYLYECTSIIVK